MRVAYVCLAPFLLPICNSACHSCVLPCEKISSPDFSDEDIFYCSSTGILSYLAMSLSLPMPAWQFLVKAEATMLSRLT